MNEGCDCAKRLFAEVQEYIRYKISNLDIQKYLSSEVDAAKLQDEVDRLLSDLDFEFKYVLQKLTVTEELEGEIDDEYKVLQSKYDDIAEVSTDQIDKALLAVQETEEFMQEIRKHRQQLVSLQEQNINPQEFQQQCVRQIDEIGKQISYVDEVVKNIQAEVHKYTAEHELLESQVISLFKR